MLHGFDRQAEPDPPAAADAGAPVTAQEPVSSDAANVHNDSPEAPADRPSLGLRRSDAWFVGAVCTVGLLLLAAHWAKVSGWGRHPVEIERLPEHRFDFRLDVNRATWVEWMQLEGIGETLALRIVEEREANGPFSSVDDVQRVKGIGPKTIEAIRPWLMCNPPAAQ